MAPGPWSLAWRRIQPVRRLTPEECDLVEYAGPLVLARVEHRVPWGPWRPSPGYVVVAHPDRIVMEASADQLAERGLSVADRPATPGPGR